MNNTIKPILVFSVLSFASGAMAQDVVREEVKGITNFARIETTVACAGAITPDSVSRIRDYGFTTIINLRRPSEEATLLGMPEAGRLAEYAAEYLEGRAG